MVKQSMILTPTLITVAHLFRELQAHDIIYCHWKAHDVHMLASLSGDSDLDILFDSKQKSRLESVLLAVGFKRFEPIRQKQYQDIVDYLILDNDSGKLIHLHAHFKLRAGKPFLKDYDLNLEQRILSTRLFNVQYNTYCIHPNWQLVLLYLMESLKLRNRDRIRFFLMSESKLSTKLMGEHEWLKTKANLAEVKYIFHEILKHPEPVNKLIENELSQTMLFKLANNFKYEFSDNSEYSEIAGSFIRWSQELILLVKKVLAKILARPIPIKRINPRGGRVLVFYGKDKIAESVLDSLQNVFNKKLDVFRISFNPVEHTHELSVSRSDKSKLARLKAARKKGMLVLCNQFPIDVEEDANSLLQQYLTDILFKWQEHSDGAAKPREKTFINSKDRGIVVPIDSTISSEGLNSFLISETWKIL